MASQAVNREEQGLHVLSFRLTQRELDMVKKTLRNFEVEGACVSEQLRNFFKGAHYRSVNYHHRLRRKREKIQKEREEEAQRTRESDRQPIQDQSPEEAEQYQSWIRELGAE